MKIIKPLILLLISFLCIGKLQAQPYVDILTVRYQHFGDASLKDNSAARVSHDFLTNSIFLPLLLPDSSRLIVGGEQLSARINYSDDFGSSSYKLYSSALQLGILHPWENRHWTTMVLFVPRIAADVHKVIEKDFQWGGAVVNTRVYSDRFKLKFGLYYNREFFGNFFMPLLGCDWKVSDRTYVWGLLPGSFNFRYKINARMAFLASYCSITSSFRAEGSPGDDYIRQGAVFWGDNHLALSFDLALQKNIIFNAGVGVPGFHHFQEYDHNNKELNLRQAFQASRDVPFITASLAYRIWLIE